MSKSMVPFSDEDAERWNSLLTWVEYRLCRRRHWHFLDRSRHVLVHVRQEFRRTRKLYRSAQISIFEIEFTGANNKKLQKFEVIIGHAPGDEEAPSTIEEKVSASPGEKGVIA